MNQSTEDYKPKINKLKTPRDFSELSNLNDLLMYEKTLEELSGNIAIYRQRYISSFFKSITDLDDNHRKNYKFFYPKDGEIFFDVIVKKFDELNLLDEKLLLVSDTEKLIYTIPSKYGNLLEDTSNKINFNFPLCLNKTDEFFGKIYDVFDRYNERIIKCKNKLIYSIDWNYKGYTVEGGTSIYTGSGNSYMTGGKQVPTIKSKTYEFHFDLKTNTFLGLKNN